ncbi:hypothetical protein D9619_011431 [Psilocybe cf. subviscida]|uniref:Amidase domain-containing protein n=1 Tax=Psilocybe cf. subviscida TaxID=2480587 RepID=A0A8H5BJ78_9AGAR|nr:hypothetical protein D9619_011431 [Psilocybe cf. subviscida]
MLCGHTGCAFVYAMVEAGAEVPGQTRGPASCAGQPESYLQLLRPWMLRRAFRARKSLAVDDGADTINAPERLTTTGCPDGSNFDAPYLYAVSSPSDFTTSPAHTPSVLHNLLVNPGILVHFKTTVPPGLLALETHSELFGVTKNLWDVASKGGGLAASAWFVVAIGISLEVCVSLRNDVPSSGRLPVPGHTTSIPGMERLPIVVGPTTRRMADWYKSMPRILNIMDGDSNINPGDWDSSSIPWDDGIIAPSLACRRALPPTSTALKKEGYEVVDFTVPNMFEGLKVGYQLMLSDGARAWRQRPHTGVHGSSFAPSLPSPLSTDKITTTFLKLMHNETVVEERANTVGSNEYRWWAERWREEGLDFVITVPMTLTALEHRKSVEMSLIGGEYMFLFGVRPGCIPVTIIDPTLDALSADFFPKQSSILGVLASLVKRIFQWLFGGASAPQQHQLPPLSQLAYDEMTAIAHKAYTTYDSDAIHGLLVGIPLVGRSLEQEKALESMVVLRDALKDGRLVGGASIRLQ